MKLLGMGVVTTDAMPQDRLGIISLAGSRISFTGVDFGTKPAIISTEIYSRDGKHISTVIKREDGEVISIEGRRESKDCTFFPSAPRVPTPETEKPTPSAPSQD